ncbi:SAM-dependent methyltransferase [Streptomyces specialis]|uniref:SAM-dependent methyltransferase n=1 Tax=Streptomyces specialis TaxID=498367 RepID=UPI00073E7953|nr:SAM-dependent methyltransferase [Streptomyces specialis]
MDDDTLPLSPPDVGVPTIARMDNYLLGGKDHYEAERQASHRLLTMVPTARTVAVHRRRFLERVVRTLARELGIRQFIDHGCGLPALDNVHEIAQRVHPHARTVYVDDDPVVASYGQAYLERDERTAFLRADIREPAAVLDHPRVRELFDPREPVAALFVSVLHCVPDQDDPAGIIGTVASRLPSGSAVVISHLVSDEEDVRERVTDFMRRRTRGSWGRVRSRQEVERCFAPLEILHPGVVDVCAWRPDSELARVVGSGRWMEYGGVGRVR